MADDINTTNIDAAQAGLQEVHTQAQTVQSDLEDLVKGTTEVDRALKSTTRVMQDTTRATKSWSQSLRDLRRSQMPMFDNLRRMGTEVNKIDTGIVALDRSIGKALSRGKVHFAAYAAQSRQAADDFRKVFVGAQKAAEGVELAADAIRDAEEGLSKLNSTMKENEKHTKKLEKEYEKLQELQRKGVDLTAEQKTRLKELPAEMARASSKGVAYQNQLTQAAERYDTAVAHGTGSLLVLRQQQEAVLAGFRNWKESIRSAQNVNNELDKMQGGLRGLMGHLNAMKQNKMWAAFETFTSAAGILASAKMIDKALTTTAQHIAKSQEIAASMGREYTASLLDSEKAADTLARTAAKTAGSMGLSLEDVKATQEKVRMGIRFDPRGMALSAEQIGKLTDEATKFSRVAGVDADTAVVMLDKRIHNFNMTAEQAVADLAGMRSMLKQMTIGVERNIVPMDKMVKIVEDASDAASSYVVDQRILAQAMRATATQAANMGANQKLAMDSAKSFGKLIGQIPDHIKIPAGQNLWNQLVGPNSEKFLAKFDEQAQKMMRSLMDSVAKGRMLPYQAQRIMMEQFKGTAAGMEAIMDEVMKYDAGLAPKLMMDWGLAESEAAAHNMMETFRKARDEQKRMVALGVEGVSVLDLMDDKYERMQKALEGQVTQEQKIAKLREMGATGEGAKKILEERRRGEEDIAALRSEKINASADEQAAIDKRIAKREAEMEVAIRKNLIDAIDPLKVAQEGLSNLTGRTLKIDETVKMGDLAKQLQRDGASQESVVQRMMDQFGLSSDASREQIKELIRTNKAISAKEVQDLVKYDNSAAAKQESMVMSREQQMQKGLLEGIRNMLHEKWPWLATPQAQMAAGVAGMVVTLGGMLFGQQRILWAVQGISDKMSRRGGGVGGEGVKGKGGDSGLVDEHGRPIPKSGEQTQPKPKPKWHERGLIGTTSQFTTNLAQHSGTIAMGGAAAMAGMGALGVQFSQTEQAAAAAGMALAQIPGPVGLVGAAMVALTPIVAGVSEAVSRWQDNMDKKALEINTSKESIDLSKAVQHGVLGKHAAGGAVVTDEFFPTKFDPRQAANEAYKRAREEKKSEAEALLAAKQAGLREKLKYLSMSGAGEEGVSDEKKAEMVDVLKQLKNINDNRENEMSLMQKYVDDVSAGKYKKKTPPTGAAAPPTDVNAVPQTNPQTGLGVSNAAATAATAGAAAAPGSVKPSLTATTANNAMDGGNVIITLDPNTASGSTGAVSGSVTVKNIAAVMAAFNQKARTV